jgi:hypothetical protein
VKVYVKLYAKALVKYLRSAASRPTDLSQPQYDALTPADSDITIEDAGNDLLTVKYGRRLEIKMFAKAGHVQEVTFR